MFLRLTKVDAAQRIVYGTATEEVVDKAREIMDYETSKPFFEAWSGDIAKATDGKSVGNVRAMHGKVAAGKLNSIIYDDGAKRIEVAAKIVDDAEWNKVDQGVYTGFSVGGSYVKKWKDAANEGVTRYTADPVEISLVDLPCVPTARFTMVKIDGTTEERTFKAPEIKEPTAAEISAKASELAKAAGDETKWADYVTPAREALIKAATNADAKPDVAETGDAVDKSAAPADGEEPYEQVWQSKRDGKAFKKKADLIAYHLQLDGDAAAKLVAAPIVDKLAELGKELDKHDGGKKPDEPKVDNVADVPKPKVVKLAHPVLLPNLSKGATAELISKSLYDVGRLASLISEISWLQESLNYEALVEADGSIVPDQLKASIASLCAVLRTLVQEETAELVGDGAAVDTFEMAAGLVPHGHIDQLVAFAAGTPAMKAASDILAKVGARHSKADNERIAKAHDLLVDLGAKCGGAGDSAKVADATELSKVVAAHDSLIKTFADISPKIDELITRVKKIEATPLPGGPARFSTVSKERDGTAGGIPDAGNIEKMLAGLTDEERVDLVIKLSQQNGRTVQIGRTG